MKKIMALLALLPIGLLAQSQYTPVQFDLLWFANNGSGWTTTVTLRPIPGTSLLTNGILSGPQLQFQMNSGTPATKYLYPQQYQLTIDGVGNWILPVPISATPIRVIDVITNIPSPSPGVMPSVYQIVASNGITITPASGQGQVFISSTATGGAGTTNAFYPTNATGVIVVGTNIWISTNYDALGAAQNATNSLIPLSSVNAQTLSIGTTNVTSGQNITATQSGQTVSLAVTGTLTNNTTGNAAVATNAPDGNRIASLIESTNAAYGAMNLWGIDYVPILPSGHATTINTLYVPNIIADGAANTWDIDLTGSAFFQNISGPNHAWSVSPTGDAYFNSVQVIAPIGAIPLRLQSSLGSVLDIFEIIDTNSLTIGGVSSNGVWFGDAGRFTNLQPANLAAGSTANNVTNTAPIGNLQTVGGPLVLTNLNAANLTGTFNGLDISNSAQRVDSQINTTGSNVTWTVVANNSTNVIMSNPTNNVIRIDRNGTPMFRVDTNGVGYLNGTQIMTNNQPVSLAQLPAGVVTNGAVTYTVLANTNGVGTTGTASVLYGDFTGSTVQVVTTAGRSATILFTNNWSPPFANTNYTVTGTMSPLLAGAQIPIAFCNRTPSNFVVFTGSTPGITTYNVDIHIDHH